MDVLPGCSGCGCLRGLGTTCNMVQYWSHHHLQLLIILAPIFEHCLQPVWRLVGIRGFCCHCSMVLIFIGHILVFLHLRSHLFVLFFFQCLIFFWVNSVSFKHIQINATSDTSCRAYDLTRCSGNDKEIHLLNFCTDVSHS